MSNNNIRYCCVHIPGFRLQITELEHPELLGKPYVLAYMAQGLQAMSENMSVAARRLRIPKGIKLTELQERWPSVPVLAPDIEKEELCVASLLHLADSQTPAYTWERDSLFLDLTGTQRLHGHDRLAWAHVFLETLKQNTGLKQIRMALASTRSAAELIAISTRHSSPMLCPLGLEREWLAKIPLRLLTVLEARIHTRFHLYNLHSMGDLQKLDRHFLQIHFGPAGEHLYAMAQGLDLQPTQPTTQCEWIVQTQLISDIHLECVIKTELGQLGEQLSSLLQVKHAESKEFKLRILYADGQSIETSKNIAQATNNFLLLQNIFEDMLVHIFQKRTAIRRMELSALQPKIRSAQIDLFSADNTCTQTTPRKRKSKQEIAIA